MKLSVFCGVSVDGFIARPNHALDFLDTDEQEPHGFEEFYDSIDVVVIGRKTFEVVLKFGKWFYGSSGWLGFFSWFSLRRLSCRLRLLRFEVFHIRFYNAAIFT